MSEYLELLSACHEEHEKQALWVRFQKGRN